MARYLPVNMLRYILMGINVFVMISGIVLLGVGIWISKYRPVVEMIGTSAGVGVAVAGAFIFFVSFCGFYGAKSLNRFMLTMYQIVLFVFSLVTLACGAVLIKFSNSVTSVIHDNCSTDVEMAKYNAAAKGAHAYLDECVHDSYTPSAIKTIYDCPDYQTSEWYGNGYADFDAFLENNFNCAGFCSANVHYTFRDRNEDVTTSCAAKLADTINTTATQAGKAFVALGVILLVLLIFSCCLCMHPQRDLYKEGLYNAGHHSTSHLATHDHHHGARH
eukprot:GILJ01000912.1.p1 GENE.GILJ01000912.1~~GILJ01000912.1.p1  ORF type:complete len:286 (-),score=55.03 GILJ01000912.1:140-964(-)